MKSIYVERHLAIKKILFRINPFAFSKHSLVSKDGMRPAVRQLLSRDFTLLENDYDGNELDDKSYKKARKEYHKTHLILVAILDSTLLKPLTEIEATAILNKFEAEYYNSITEELAIAVAFAEWSDLDKLLTIDNPGIIMSLIKGNVISRGGKYLYHRGDGEFVLTGELLEVIDILEKPLSNLDEQYLEAVIIRNYWQDEPEMLKEEIRLAARSLLEDGTE